MQRTKKFILSLFEKYSIVQRLKQFRDKYLPRKINKLRIFLVISALFAFSFLVSQMNVVSAEGPAGPAGTPGANTPPAITSGLDAIPYTLQRLSALSDITRRIQLQDEDIPDGDDSPEPEHKLPYTVISKPMKQTA